MPRKGTRKPEKPIAYDADNRPIFGFNADHQPVCHSRKRGKPDSDRCMKTQRMANGRCELHGGKSLVGAAHGNAKTLKFSKLFPVRLQVVAEQAQEEAAGVDLMAELAYLDIREADLIASLSKRDNSETLKAAEEAFQKAYRAMQSQDWDAMNAGMVELRDVLAAGAHDSAIWSELLKVIDKRVKVAMAQHKQKTQDAGMLHAALVLDLNYRAVAILRSAVEMNIVTQFNNLLADIRIAVAGANELDSAATEIALDIIAPLVTAAAERTEDLILSDVSDGIRTLMPTAEKLPSGNGLRLCKPSDPAKIA